MKKLSAYQKLKAKNQKLNEEKGELLAELYAILDGNFEVSTKYKMFRKINNDFEKDVWFGSPSHQTNTDKTTDAD